ncbi:unnamed protein product [Aspergillus oryzae var. brunneus]|uniref:Unnamed protein product n=2 Tax=Aspergillus oryzae TaxID=5062 RepID=A0AAN4YUA2_ASPOZ|nr:unnamed protein product [Aspergillus oryzae]GMG48628.1 unnamed protein product [Aspergillus oryzae var. brunneus]
MFCSSKSALRAATSPLASAATKTAIVSKTLTMEGSDLTVQAIISVLHEPLTSDDDYATLLVTEYPFQCSLTNWTQFKSAMIKVKFIASDDGTTRRLMARNVAPDGTFFLNPEGTDITDILIGNGPAKAGAGPWKLTENKSKKGEIPSMLHTTISVTQKVPVACQLIVSIQTEANRDYALKEEARSFIGGKKVDIVNPADFVAGEARQSVEPGLLGVNLDHLVDCDLHKLQVAIQGEDVTRR